MKPNQLRARRKAQEKLDETVNAAYRSAIEAAIHGESRDIVVKELIPTEAEHVEASREARRLVRQAERQPRGAGRDRKLDELIVAMGRLVFIERVMELDRLERAGLTPRRLWDMSRISPEDLQARLAEMKRVARSAPEVTR